MSGATPAVDFGTPNAVVTTLLDDGKSVAAAQQTCFAAGTLVLAKDGPRPIEDIKIGDEVLCKSDGDPAGPLLLRVVERVFKHSPTALVNIHIDDLVVRSTANHPFWLEGKGWTHAAKLAPGDRVIGHDNRLHAVTELFDNGDVEPVFNFAVAEHHTYFVASADGAISALVHNDYNESGGAAAPVTDPGGFHLIDNDHVFKVVGPDGKVHVYYVNAGWLLNSVPDELGTIAPNGTNVVPKDGGYPHSYADVQNNASSWLTGSDWKEFFSHQEKRGLNIGRGGAPPAGSGGTAGGDKSNKGDKPVEETNAPKRSPASEKTAKDIAKRIEQDLGKEARREFHDAKESGLGDRTLDELKEDTKALYEQYGKQIPTWLQ